MAEGGQHRVGKGTLVPRTGVAAAVDEKCGRRVNAAAVCALDILAHAQLRGFSCGVMRAVAWRQFEVLRDPTEVTLRKNRTLLHECLVRPPELSGRLGSILGKFGGACSKLVAGDWPAMERVLAQMSRWVGQLLELARVEDPARLEDSAGLGPVNLARLAREAAAMVLPLAEERGRALEVEAAAVVSLPGRPDELRDAMRNLMENALVHGGGAVRVSVREESGDGTDRWAVVEVADQGPGIAEELRDAVFDRFRKAVPASPGAGLGLAIVRQVVSAHGGEVHVRPGPGCRVKISLPMPG